MFVVNKKARGVVPILIVIILGVAGLIGYLVLKPTTPAPLADQRPTPLVEQRPTPSVEQSPSPLAEQSPTPPVEQSTKLAENSFVSISELLSNLEKYDGQYIRVSGYTKEPERFSDEAVLGEKIRTNSFGERDLYGSILIERPTIKDRTDCSIRERVYPIATVCKAFVEGYFGYADDQGTYGNYIKYQYLIAEKLASLTPTPKPITRNITWAEATELIESCEVVIINQAHSLDVSLELRDNSVAYTKEPEIDLVIKLAEQYSDKCGRPDIYTE